MVILVVGFNVAVIHEIIKMKRKIRSVTSEGTNEITKPHKEFLLLMLFISLTFIVTNTPYLVSQFIFL